jgi:hypothetical protein
MSLHPSPLSEVSAAFLVELRAVRAWAVYSGDTRKAVLAGMLLVELTDVAGDRTGMPQTAGNATKDWPQSPVRK